MKLNYWSLLFLMVFAFQNSGVAGPSKKKAIRVLFVGGGESHDFNRWFKQEDVKTLQRDGFADVVYTDDPTTILSQLPQADVLILSNNQPIKDVETRKAIFSFVESGKGVVLLHAALWYNWRDWPEYNKTIVGGGSRGHDKYGPFAVTVTQPKHAIMKGVPARFELKDELYYFKTDAEGSPIQVLATAKADASENVFPSVFVVNYGKTRIAGIALGHDAASHEIAPYQTLLRNAVKWASKKK